MKWLVVLCLVASVLAICPKGGETWWGRRNPNRCEYRDVNTGNALTVPSGCCKCPGAFRLQLCGSACFDKVWKTEVAVSCCRGTHRYVRPNSFAPDPLEAVYDANRSSGRDTSFGFECPIGSRRRGNVAGQFYRNTNQDAQLLAQ